MTNCASVRVSNGLWDHRACGAGEGQWTTRGALVAFFRALYRYYMGTAVAQWLRCCATNRKVAGSIPAAVIGIFH